MDCTITTPDHFGVTLVCLHHRYCSEFVARMESQFPCHTYLSGIGVLGRTQKAVLSAVDAGEKAAEKFRVRSCEAAGKSENDKDKPCICGDGRPCCLWEVKYVTKKI